MNIISGTKPFSISRHLVWKAYELVKQNKGAAGIDNESIKEFEEVLAGGKKKKIEEALRVCYGKLDTAAAKGTIHKNTASRKKARLTAQVKRAAGK